MLSWEFQSWRDCFAIIMSHPGLFIITTTEKARHDKKKKLEIWIFKSVPASF